jgi:hypothetical protein
VKFYGFYVRGFGVLSFYVTEIKYQDNKFEKNFDLLKIGDLHFKIFLKDGKLPPEYKINTVDWQYSYVEKMKGINLRLKEF